MCSPQLQIPGILLLGYEGQGFNQEPDKHVKTCWSEEAWNVVNECSGAVEAQDMVVKPMSKMESISTIFKWLGKGKVMYSHQMHTKTELKCVGCLVFRSTN